MTPLQQKFRIKRLWKKARLVLLFEKMRLRSQNRHQQYQMNSDEDHDGDDDILNNISQPEASRKWWIIRQENTLPQIWSFIINSLTFYALFSTPFVLVFKESKDDLILIENMVDICFTMDIILNFFKLKSH